MSQIEIDEKLHEDLVSYVDGELNDEAKARVETILEESSEARTIVSELEQLGAVMGEFTVDEPPVELDFKVETAARRALKKRRPRRMSRFVGPAAGVMAAAACAVLVLTVFFLQNAEDVVFVVDSDRSIQGEQDQGILTIDSRPQGGDVIIDGEAVDRGRFAKNDPTYFNWEVDPGAYRVDLVTRSVDTEGRDDISPLPGDGWGDEDTRQRELSNTTTRGEPSMVIRTARMRLIVDDLERSVRRVEDAVARRDGHVQRSSVERQSALIVARVPSDELDELRQTLRGLGEIIADQTRAQDVTGEVMDIESRLRSARVTEERLLALAADRTSNVEQILAVERELMRVREEIERLDGRQSTLRDQVSLSTITIELDERFEPVRRSASERLGEAAQDGVGNVGALLLDLGEVTAAYGLSFLLIAVLAYAAIRLGLAWLRRRRAARG